MKVTGQCLHIQEEILIFGGLLLALMALGPILVLKAMAIMVRLGKILRCLVLEKTQAYHKVLGQELLSDQWYLLDTSMDHHILVMLYSAVMTCLEFGFFQFSNIDECFKLRAYPSHVLLHACCTYGFNERSTTLHSKSTSS